MEAIYSIDNKNGFTKEYIIPWTSKKDLGFFVDKTKNNVVIMGRNTYFSMLNHLTFFKNTLNIVLTSKPEEFLSVNDGNRDVIFTNNDNIHNSILNYRENYLKLYPFLNSNFKILFIGGKKIYEKYIPLCDKVWVSQIKKDYSCDSIFDYNFSNQFKEPIIIEDNNELKITLYENMKK